MTFSLGTISHGTLIPADLIQAFSDRLATMPDLDISVKELIADSIAHLEQLAGDYDPPVSDESAHWLLERLTDALNERAPAYVYFGALEGDGSDFGFWPDMDLLEEDAEHGDGVAKINAGAGWQSTDAVSQPEIVHYVMAVTDHGNMTLYERTMDDWAELWSIV